MTVVGVEGPAHPSEFVEKVGGRARTLLAALAAREVWVIHPFPIVEVVETLIDTVDYGVRGYGE